MALVVTALGFASCGPFLGRGARPGDPEPVWARELPANMPLTGRLEVRPDARDEPAVELRLPVDNRAALRGWGAVHLWARPAVDEVGVSAIIDAPSRRARWRGCREAHLESRARRAVVPASYVGAPLPGDESVYDAVQLRISIDVIRALSEDRHARWTVCGDPFVLSAPQRRNLRRFVDWFDLIATPAPRGEGPFFRDVGPRPEMPIEIEPEPPLDA